jgi:hypothetical protein
MSLFFVYGCRAMAEPISQQLQHTHVPEMAMLWLLVLVYHFRSVVLSDTDLLITHS